jgi:hypothetical protein
MAPRIGREEGEPLAHGIASWRGEQDPAGETEVVFRGSAFAYDVARSNLTAISRQSGLEKVRSLYAWRSARPPPDPRLPPRRRGSIRSSVIFAR